MYHFDSVDSISLRIVLGTTFDHFTVKISQFYESYKYDVDGDEKAFYN